MIGIYKITNLVNNKVYIGQSKNIDYRFSLHKSYLLNNHHENIHLQRAWNRYGEENFKFEVIEECEESKLTEKEQYWIDYYGGLNSNNNYNLRDASSVGKMSNISRQKMSIAKLGTKREKWVCEKLSKSFKGKNSCWKGKHLSEEHKRKISESNKGRKQTSEHIKKATETRIKNGSYENLKYNEERSRKIKEALTGRVVSDETKKKTSESIKLWWKERKESGRPSNN